ncbi:MAG: chorismate synthase, partial [Methanomassiliicoccales archaeon]
MNTIGTSLRLTVLGTSHGPWIGCIVDGCPAGLDVTEGTIQQELDLRKPSDEIGTSRKEEDRAEVLSGIVNGKTTGAPIAIFIRNKDVDSSKYDIFRTVPRPGHADFPALVKYGESHDLRGGGQFSGRMTAPIVAAGAIAKTILAKLNVRVAAYTRAIGNAVDEESHSFD